MPAVRRPANPEVMAALRAALERRPDLNANLMSVGAHDVRLGACAACSRSGDPGERYVVLVGTGDACAGHVRALVPDVADLLEELDMGRTLARGLPRG